MISSNAAGLPSPPRETKGIVDYELFHAIRAALRAIVLDEYAKQQDLRKAMLFANVAPINDCTAFNTAVAYDDGVRIWG